jgi:CRP/FNR family transcriptional regulator, cyclic AMP receptor protein
VNGGRLASIPFFAGLPEEELETVARAATEVEFAAGRELITEGDLGHCLFVVEAGTAKVTSGGETRDEVGPGDVVGEIAVLSSGRRTASVVATTPVRALKWFKRDVWALEHSALESARRLRAALDGHRE